MFLSLCPIILISARDACLQFQTKFISYRFGVLERLRSYPWGIKWQECMNIQIELHWINKQPCLSCTSVSIYEIWLISFEVCLHTSELSHENYPTGLSANEMNGKIPVPNKGKENSYLEKKSLFFGNFFSLEKKSQGEKSFFCSQNKSTKFIFRIDFKKFVIRYDLWSPVEPHYLLTTCLW